MNCEESRMFLAAYLDDELDVTGSLRVQKHLLECAQCRRAQDEHIALRAALRDPELYAEPSAAFSGRLQASVRRAAKEEARKDRVAWWAWPKWTLAAAVVLVIALAMLVMVNRGGTSRDRILASEVVSAHIRSLQPGHLVDVASSDHHTVKPWFQGKLDFSPPVADLAPSGWTLTGGRLDYLDGHPAAALIYARRLHQINVFVWPNRGGADETVHEESAQGYQVLHWTTAGMTYWVVSDLNPAELLELARALGGK